MGFENESFFQFGIINAYYIFRAIKAQAEI